MYMFLCVFCGLGLGLAIGCCLVTHCFVAVSLKSLVSLGTVASIAERQDITPPLATILRLQTGANTKTHTTLRWQ